MTQNMSDRGLTLNKQKLCIKLKYMLGCSGPLTSYAKNLKKVGGFSEKSINVRSLEENTSHISDVLYTDHLDSIPRPVHHSRLIP